MVQVVALGALVGLAVTTGRVKRAVRVAGAVDALLGALGAVLEPVEHDLYNAAVNTARSLVQRYSMHYGLRARQ